MEIRTERLLLRSARATDADDLHAIFRLPQAMTWWSTPPHATRDETVAWLGGMIANGPDHPDFVIELGGRAIGKVGFYRPPDIGYILHPDAWGRGYAREAASAAIDHLFATTDHDTITADVDPDNAASLGLMARLGFVRTGFAERTWNIAGAWKDSVYLALTRASWERRL